MLTNEYEHAQYNFDWYLHTHFSETPTWVEVCYVDYHLEHMDDNRK